MGARASRRSGSASLRVLGPRVLGLLVLGLLVLGLLVLGLLVLARPSGDHGG
ncbi:hypothetical protein GCM10025875_04550 [Litorihabitans aurantiacus]|uniref:Uncharacterized protein n=1 Tax=Litorihabitans aurantiacus TaxID=1930061 RepID=A0AA37XD13_9MICO|nr:hypothetical protein GCM10025875_04550 [Litorihabitans aurantiacus]